MKIFLDTNIILDYILSRSNAEYAKQIIEMGIKQKITTAVSILTIANIAYVCRKGESKNDIKDEIKWLTEITNVLPMDKEQLKLALVFEAPDFEDVLQYQCAISAEYDIIITNNKKDYLFSKIPVYTSNEFIKLMSK